MGYQEELAVMVTEILKRYVGHQELQAALRLLDTSLVLLKDQFYEYELHKNGQLYSFHLPQHINHGSLTAQEAAEQYASRHARDKPLETVQALLNEHLDTKVQVLLQNYAHRCEIGWSDSLLRI